MSKIDYQALRELAKQATQGEWVAFISPGTGTYAVHTPGDKRCEDVIKWPGFDGQKKAAANARYIAAFNPEVVQALLDELDSANGYASAYEAEKWHYHGLAESEGERADRAEKQVEELTMLVKRLAHSLRNARPDSKLHSDAMDYLSRKGLISVEDVLR